MSLLIVGTLDAAVPGIPFVSRRRVSRSEKYGRPRRCLKGILTEDQMRRFKRGIIKNFLWRIC